MASSVGSVGEGAPSGRPLRAPTRDAPTGASLHQGKERGNRRESEQDWSPGPTHERGEFATGLIYVEPQAKDFIATLNLVDEPLATLSEAQVRPPRAVLDEIMDSLA